MSEQVKVLDGVVRYRFGDNAELMGAWANAHSVVGPFRSILCSLSGLSEEWSRRGRTRCSDFFGGP